MNKLLLFLLLLFVSYNNAYGAYPIAPQKATLVYRASTERLATGTDIRATLKATKPQPPGQEGHIADEEWSVAAILAFTLPIAAILFFIAYGSVSAGVVALICGVVGIASILLGDSALSSDKKGKGLAITGYVLGTAGAVVATSIGFYYLLTLIF